MKSRISGTIKSSATIEAKYIRDVSIVKPSDLLKANYEDTQEQKPRTKCDKCWCRTLHIFSLISLLEWNNNFSKKKIIVLGPTYASHTNSKNRTIHYLCWIESVFCTSSYWSRPTYSAHNSAINQQINISNRTNRRSLGECCWWNPDFWISSCKSGIWHFLRTAWVCVFSSPYTWINLVIVCTEGAKDLTTASFTKTLKLAKCLMLRCVCVHVLLFRFYLYFITYFISHEELIFCVLLL